MPSDSISGAKALASCHSQRVVREPGAVETTNWYAEGEAMRVIVGDTEVIVRFVGRKGRKARIAIVAPPGAQFDDMPPPIIHGPH